MGAAISHALLLSTSLPTVLSPSFPASDVKTKITTGTVECVDELLPDEDDEDEDEGGMRVRHKSFINIDIVIGDGVHATGGKSNKGKLKHTIQPLSESRVGSGS